LVSTNTHVDTFSWSHDSTSIIYHLLSHSDAESTSQPVTEAIVSIDTGAVRHTFTHPSLPGRPTVWRSSEDLVFLQNRSFKLLSSRALWFRDIAGSAPVHLAYGDNEDALHIVNLNTKSQYAIQVASGLRSRIEVFDADNKSFIVFETNEEDIGQWDMKLLDDGHYVFVAVRSSAVHGEPLDIWSGCPLRKCRSPSLSTGLLRTDKVCKLLSPTPRALNCVNYQPLSFLMAGQRRTYSVSCISENPSISYLCFINFVRRGTLHLSFEDWSWRHFLASNGYLVFSPNYRGT